MAEGGAIPPGRIVPADDAAITEAARLLASGRLVAFPTETVYGLGADATNERAVAGIFAAKGRPRFNPLIVHFADRAAVARHVVMDARAEALARRFWPGPLTLVLPRTPDTPVSRLASAGLDTLAVRMPGHPLARRLIAALGRPVAAPSANRFADISPTTAAHVAESLGTAPAMILDGGPTRVGIESTVLDLSVTPAVLLRPGGITGEEIESVIGPLGATTEETGDETRARKSPGQVRRHYAPRHPLRLDATALRPGEALLAFGPALPPGWRDAPAIANLSESGDTVEAAANLFAMLRRLDASGAEAIAAMPIPGTGLGLAINDRLQHAAEPLSEPGTGA